MREIRRNYLIDTKRIKKAADRQCSGKKKYTLKEARTAANEAHHSGRVRKARLYFCEYCKSWHMARQQSLEKRFKD